MYRYGLRNSECDIPGEDISAYFDGELSGAELERIKKHIDGCESCRRLLASLERTSSYVEGAKAEIPSNLHDSIMATVTAHKVTNRKGKSFADRIRKAGLWCGAGVAAVICLTLVGSPIFRGGMFNDAKSAEGALNFSKSAPGIECEDGVADIAIAADKAEFYYSGAVDDKSEDYSIDAERYYDEPSAETVATQKSTHYVTEMEESIYYLPLCGNGEKEYSSVSAENLKGLHFFRDRGSLR